MNEALTFKIGADTAAFQSDIKKVMGRIAALGATFLGVQAVARSFSDAIEMGGRLDDLAKRTGIAVGELSVLERAFDKSGVGADALGGAVNKLQKFLSDAGAGGEAQTDTLAQLGLTFEQLKTLAPTEQMEAIAEGLVKIGDPGERAAAAMRVFGKSGGQLLPLLDDFSGEIEGAKRQLGGLPSVMNTSSKSLAEIGDSLEAIQTKGMEAAVGLLETLAPALEEITGRMSEANAVAFGQKIGAELTKAVQGFAAWFANPGASLAAFALSAKGLALDFGNTFLAGIKYAGDWLGNFFSAIGDNMPAKIRDGLVIAALNFATRLDMAIMDMLSALMGIPGPLGEAAQSAFDFMDETLTKTHAMGRDFEKGAKAISDAFEEANKNTQFIKEDVLGAGEAYEAASVKAQEAMASGAEKIEGAAEKINNAKPKSVSTGDGSGRNQSDTLSTLRGMDQRKIGEAGKRARAATKLEKVEQQAKEARAGGNEAKAKRLEEQAKKLRGTAMGEPSKKDPSQLLTSIDTWLEKLNNKLPTPALAP
jgi:hypothetical protein